MGRDAGPGEHSGGCGDGLLLVWAAAWGMGGKVGGGRLLTAVFCCFSRIKRPEWEARWVWALAYCCVLLFHTCQKTGVASGPYA